MTAEVETMFYYKEVPWHRLGKQVTKVLKAEEAIIEAGLNWDVEIIPLYHRYEGKVVKIEDRVATRRTTDRTILGIVTPKYSPVQNIDAFKFFDAVTGTGEAKYHTAGSLRNGKRIWILAKMNDSIGVKGDEVDKYLLLMNGHDGSLALKMFFTPIRVVCSNTLAMAEAGADLTKTFYAKHLGDITARVENAKEILGLTNQFFKEFQEKALYLASHQLPPAELPKLLAGAFGTSGSIRPEDVVQLNDFGTTRKINEMERVQALFEGEGKGLNEPGIKGTKWAAYNAVVEYVDYAKKFSGENPNDNRLEAVWLSTGQRIKQRAMDYLLA